ncbi:hypothetical protein [Pyrobaculum aerophilum]|uniref:hypothetical protein n=1 Tax=Pyrobaculum aerophilum TaxID=13773 RepID=UPI0023EFBBD5|nr:hypothetical protein [Pyrobaculum aerophilum]MCX8137274.1 hypothetical protein [Pyrobaculum aerophilum]
MFCISLQECIENIKPRQILVASSPLGGLGVLALAQSVKLTVATSGPVFNKIAVLEAIDNYGAEVRYVPKLHTAIYKLIGDRECWVAGPPLIKSVVAGNSTSFAVYTCAKIEGFEKLLTSGKPIEALSSKVLGGGRDGRDFDVVVQLRALQIKGDDEEDIADRIVRSGAVGVDDLDVVSQLLWRIAVKWRNRSAVIYRDLNVGLGITIPMLYYSVKVIASGKDCPEGKCVKTTTKLIERALRLAPPAKIHEAWQTALREPQMRRRIEESPYLPAVLLLTGKVDVKYEGGRVYTLRST